MKGEIVMLSILKKLREEENHIQILLSSAIEVHGSDHVDMITEVDEDNQPTLAIIYHSRHDSFGIESNIPLTNVRLKALQALESFYDIWLDTEALETAGISLAD